MSIKLNIKSPTALEDKCLSSALDSTVLDVKKQILEEWPTHPSPKDQRLVYAGKLLEDDTILKDVLRLEDARDENDAFTIHLVCRITTPPPPIPASSAAQQPPKENSTLRHRRTNVNSNQAESVQQSASNSWNQVDQSKLFNSPDPFGFLDSSAQKPAPLLRRNSIAVSDFEIEEE